MFLYRTRALQLRSCIENTHVLQNLVTTGAVERFVHNFVMLIQCTRSFCLYGEACFHCFIRLRVAMESVDVMFRSKVFHLGFMSVPDYSS